MFIPLSLMAGELPRLSLQSGRMLVRTFTLFGFVVLVSGIYLVVVLGLGHKPSDTAERTILGLSLLATAIAAGHEEAAIATLLCGAVTDHVFIDEGHTIDFTNKAFECLQHIGWGLPEIAWLVGRPASPTAPGRPPMRYCGRLAVD